MIYNYSVVYFVQKVKSPAVNAGLGHKRIMASDKVEITRNTDDPTVITITERGQTKHYPLSIVEELKLIPASPKANKNG